MPTINVSNETKERFKKLKWDLASKQSMSISEDELVKILIEKFNAIKTK
jgi:hypothetical protein